jgi:hypothetical protein
MMFSPKMLVNVALQVFTPEKIKAAIENNIDPVLEMIFSKAQEIELTETETQAAVLIIKEHDPETEKPGLFALIVTIDQHQQISRTIKAWNIRQSILSTDIKALTEKLTQNLSENE